MTSPLLETRTLLEFLSVISLVASSTDASLSRIITSGFNTIPTGEESRPGIVVGAALFSTY
ncbi:MAG TPA: hypothetical protein VIX38_03550, partial [Nitrososphaeraceae archaeon]